MADAKKASKAKSPGGGGPMILNPKVFLAAAGIALISSASSFIAIRLAMPRQIIIEKVTKHDADKQPKLVLGPEYPVGDFIVNLNDPSGQSHHYLKASITLQMAQDASAKKGGGDGAPDITAQMAPYLPIYKDTIIATLSRESASVLQTPDGREGLKNELRDQLNAQVPQEKVMGVYFTDFVIE